MPNKWLGINIGKAAHNFELFRQTGSFLYHGWYSSIWMVLLVLFSSSNPKLSYTIHFQYFPFCDCVLLRHCFVFHTVNPIAILSDRFTLFPSVYMRTYHFIYIRRLGRFIGINRQLANTKFQFGFLRSSICFAFAFRHNKAQNAIQHKHHPYTDIILGIEYLCKGFP